MPTNDLSTAEAARMLKEAGHKISERTVRRMIERGTLKGYKIDPDAKSVYRIPMAEIQRLLADRAADPNADPGERAPKSTRN